MVIKPLVQNYFEALIKQQKEGGAPIIPFDIIENTTKASFAALESLQTGSWVEIE